MDFASQISSKKHEKRVKLIKIQPKYLQISQNDFDKFENGNGCLALSTKIVVNDFEKVLIFLLILNKNLLKIDPKIMSGE